MAIAVAGVLMLARIPQKKVSNSCTFLSALRQVTNKIDPIWCCITKGAKANTATELLLAFC